MSKLFLTEPVEITTLEGNVILLSNSVYNLSNDKLATKNGFYRCPKCKDFFDKVCQKGINNDDPEKWYCEKCFDKL